jgi:diguanylate cyclase (GGDEF)-like protein
MIFASSPRRKDPRVCDSAYADTWVFYAGVPLHFENQRVGVLCIGDNKPRQFEKDHLNVLRDLAAMAEHELEVAALSEKQVALAMSNEELGMKARIDVLTHLWNRGAIFQLLADELASRSSGSGIAALMIDVDHFKKINDTYGHPAGDQVLRVVSERLRKAVRPMDAVGRYGGEEFLAVLTNVNRAEAGDAARRICETVARTPVHFEDAVIPVTCSIGCAFAEQMDSADTLVSRADRALYVAKAAGRNRVQTGEPLVRWEE